ncbi:hypothetical protein FACS1894110_24680 [Spirochaetia bacterium]|nr:hypothetical protein FACS1894110_24680 [Spirochaetia bacterium]
MRKSPAVPYEDRWSDDKNKICISASNKDYGHDIAKAFEIIKEKEDFINGKEI